MSRVTHIARHNTHTHTHTQHREELHGKADSGCHVAD